MRWSNENESSAYHRWLPVIEQELKSQIDRCLDHPAFRRTQLFRKSIVGDLFNTLGYFSTEIGGLVLCDKLD